MPILVFMFFQIQVPFTQDSQAFAVHRCYSMCDNTDAE